MRCVIPSISNVSLANIIFRLTLFVNNSFELGFCFIPCTLHESHLLLKNCLSQPFFAFQKVAIILNETLLDYTIILFELHSLRHILITQSWRKSWRQWNKIFSLSLCTKLFYTKVCFQCCSFQVFIPLNVNTFLLSFTMIHTVLFFIFTRL